jgi:hypothetical protein
MNGILINKPDNEVFGGRGLEFKWSVKIKKRNSKNL